MAAEMGHRDVAAPVRDWLSKRDVCELIEVSDSTLDRLIASGQFPRAVQFPGENRSRWRWVDVAWYLLGREVSDRLVADGDSSMDPTEGSPGLKRGSQATK